MLLECNDAFISVCEASTFNLLNNYPTPIENSNLVIQLYFDRKRYPGNNGRVISIAIIHINEVMENACGLPKSGAKKKDTVAMRKLYYTMNLGPDDKEKCTHVTEVISFNTDDNTIKYLGCSKHCDCK